MPRWPASTLATAALIALFAAPALAIVHAGDPAPNFMKTQLGGGIRSLDSYAGKVVVLFLYGAG